MKLLMNYRKNNLGAIFLIATLACCTAFGGKIVYPWRATTAIVKSGETFYIWFNADVGQTVNSVELRGPYNTVNTTNRVAPGSWEYDKWSGNTSDRKITVTVLAGDLGEILKRFLRTAES
jgi:hypothetical protein